LSAVLLFVTLILNAINLTIFLLKDWYFITFTFIY
jgi:hypothetical protein